MSYAFLGKAVFSFAAICGAFVAGPAIGHDRSIVVASTTSTQDSGLFDYLLPLFTQKTGIGVKVLALGTGEALDAGRRGEADVVFVHAKWAEQKFVAEGEGVKRYGVILVDPAKHPHVRKDLGQRFIDWLVSREGQKAIASYKINGEQFRTAREKRLVCAQPLRLGDA